MKRPFSLLLALVLLLSACSSGEPASSSSDDTEAPSAEEIALAVLDACGRNADGLERTDRQLDDSALSAYLTNFYGLEEDSWTDCAIYRAGSAEAFEIAVLRFAEDADMDAAASGLTAYILSREGDFTGYAPEQAAIVHDSLVARQQRFAALLICENAPAARAAFNAFFEENVHPDASAGVSDSPSVTPSASPEVTPEPSPETEPSQSSEPVQPVNPSQEITPPPPEVPSPKPDPSPSPSPEPSPSQPAGYSDRIPFDPPGVDDMTVYNTSSILAAWVNGDPSVLSDYDRTIYDRCRGIFDAYITDSMSDYDKELTLYSVLTHMAVYDDDHYDHFAKMDPASYTPYGPLINGKGVCLGFATAFQLLMDLSGIRCITVVGAAFYSREDHAWNMVNLNGQWYCADPTWDLGKSWFTYFNVTSDYMADTNHQWDYANVPEATATDGGK